ncbi:F0F1 ATP synthase subunit B' [Paracoccus laeviglucosivorans]|uniref:ATP synthase subunit b n=1 Tax=Paracoccus laeviglucosivorans TaxID=1197861 RepID=A0A521CHQ1_9RHOB|nr:F0F1 ATP synthase subunit B' [Paracoccus laeviglucosivorans]SMO58885.1 F-type H+-transporting ATPase subunit b [Paracoccus laeviglucosivorans]
MISLLQQTAPVVVEESETVIITEHGAEAAAAHGADAAHAAAGAAGHAASAPGMPQLDITTFGNQIFWLLVVLAVIYWVLSRVALPRIGGVISDRQGAITGDLMAAEEFKQKAKDAEAAYDKALADARAEASKIVAANKAEIQKELDAAIAHADAEIAARAVESEKRIGEIRASAVEDARSVAREVTEALVQSFGGNADQGLINAAVDQRLKGALQ